MDILFKIPFQESRCQPGSILPFLWYTPYPETVAAVNLSNVSSFSNFTGRQTVLIFSVPNRKSIKVNQIQIEFYESAIFYFYPNFTYRLDYWYNPLSMHNYPISKVQYH